MTKEQLKDYLRQLSDEAGDCGNSEEWVKLRHDALVAVIDASVTTPVELRAPYLNNPGWTCPKCGLTEAGHVQRECDWKAEPPAHPQYLPKPNGHAINCMCPLCRAENRT